MRNLLVLGLASLALLFANSPSFACPAKGGIFQDSFTDASGGWEPDSTLSFGAGGLKVTYAPTGVTDPELNAAFFASDGDYCADAVFPASVPNAAYVGLLFWAMDYNNEFLFQISTSGHAQLYRKLTGTWIKIMDITSPAIKTAPGATNELRLVAKGNLITMYVNGQNIAERRGQAPASRNLRFGIWTQLDSATPGAAARTFEFKDYTVN